MRRIFMGLILLLHGHVVFAAPAASLVQGAGLTPSAQPRVAVDFQLSSLQGQNLRLQEQRGKVVLLNFWATWCPPCLGEMPEMEKLYQAFREQPFAMWAVAMQEGREQVAPFVKENHLHFSILFDVAGEVIARYGIRGLPTTYLIDCAGKIVGHAVGPRNWNDNPVRMLLTSLLNDDQCR